MDRTERFSFRVKLMTVSILLIVAMFCISVFSLSNSRNFYNEFNEQLTEVSDLQEITMMIDQMTDSVSDYILSGDKTYMSDFDKNKQFVSSRIQEYETSAGQEVWIQIFYLGNTQKAYLKKVDEVIRSYNEGELQTVIEENMKEVIEYGGFVQDQVDQVTNVFIEISRDKREEATQQLISNEKYLMTLIIVVSIIAVVLSFVTSNEILKPIYSLSKKLKRVADGNYDVTMEKVKRKGDLGVLLDSFHFMIERMKEREKLEEINMELEIAKEVAEESNTAKSGLLANVSHEIRTPLNAILGYSQIIVEDETLSAITRKNVESINKSGNHLQVLINDILDMSKFEANRIKIKKEPVNIKEIITLVSDMLRNSLEEKGLGYIVNIEPNFPVELLGDRRRLKQVLVNLIGNAIKFTEEGYIEVNATIKGNMYEISISDTGIGIPDSMRDRIFDAFEQTEEGSSKTVGTGLGLSISRNIAKLLGGELTLTSEVNKGSTFVLTCPMEMLTRDDEYSTKKYEVVDGHKELTEGNLNLVSKESDTDCFIKEHMKLLSIDLVKVLRQELQKGNIEGIGRAIKEIGEIDHELGERLEIYFEEFEFDYLLSVSDT